MNARRRARTDDGAVVVEAAMGIPVVILFVFALVDLGMWTFQTNQATNAARDGARAGILGFEDADVQGSDSWDAILAAVEERLDRDVDASELTVNCVEPDGTDVAGGCAFAEPRTDRIVVEVAWVWPLVTPVGVILGRDEGTATGTATVEIIGLPEAEPDPASTTTTTTSTTSTTLAPGCTVSSWSLSNDPIEARTNGRLLYDLTVDFTADVLGCTDLSVVVQAPSTDTIVQDCGCGLGPAFSWTIGKNDHGFWTAGTASLQIIDSGDIIVDTTVEVIVS